MPSTPLPAAATGLPASFQLAIAALSIVELHAAHVACSAAADAYQAVLNQPRCKGAAAINLLDGEADRAGYMMQEIVAEMQRRRPAGVRERAIRARLLAEVAVGTGEWRDALQAITDVLAPEAVH